MQQKCGKLPDEVSWLQLSNSALQALPVFKELLEILCFIGSGGLWSIVMPFDVTFVERSTILVTLTVT